MSEEMKMVSVAAVDRVIGALVEIIADQSQEISGLADAITESVTADHSCDVVERQVFELFKLAGEHVCVPSFKIHNIFGTDPADD